MAEERLTIYGMHDQNDWDVTTMAFTKELGTAVIEPMGFGGSCLLPSPSIKQENHGKITICTSFSYGNHGFSMIFPYPSQVTRWFTHHKFSVALPHLPPKGDVILLVNDLQVRIEAMVV